MSESKGALKVIVPLVLVAGGAGYWFFGIHQPGQEKAAAQAEIEEWGKQWNDARACLIGAKPASSDLRVALAARQLLPDPWDTGSCTTKLGGLTRKAGVDTGLAAVERAWTRQDLAVIALAKAFGDWVVNSKYGDLPVAGKVQKEDKLPTALDELAASYAFLRESAGMAAPPPLTTQDATAATLIPLKLGTEQLVNLEQDSFLDAGLAFASARTGYAQIVLHPGAAPDVQPNQAGVVRSVSANWAAVTTETGVMAGTPDDKGVVSASSTSVALPGFGQVLGVVGDAKDGLIVYRSADGLHIIHSAGGTLTADPPIPNFGSTVLPDFAGKSILIEFSDPAQTTFTARATSGAPLTFLPLPVSLIDYTDGCLTKTKAWRGNRANLVAYDATGAIATWESPHRFDILGCSPEAVVLSRKDQGQFTVCGDDAALGANPDLTRKPVATPPTEPPTSKPIATKLTCRDVTISGPRTYALTGVAGKGPILVAVRDRAAAVWREGAPVQLFALPERLLPVAVHASDKAVDIFGTLDAKDDNRPLAIARLPL